MKEELYVEDVIVPLLAIPKSDESKRRFMGSGFYVDGNGHLVTCRHVVDQLNVDEILCAYQLGKRKELELRIITKSNKYDLALCKNSSDISDIKKPWPIIDKPFIEVGNNVEVYGYVHEPLGPNEPPFRQRYMKGYITGTPRDTNYPDSFELNFPILFGMSGSPLVCHIPIEGTSKNQTCIVGCAYGSYESRVVQESVTLLENEVNREVEKVVKIVELGLAYMPGAILSIFEGSDISIEYFH